MPHPGRLLIGVGALVAGIAVLGPHVSIPVAGTIDGIDGTSWPALVPLVLAAAAALAPRDRSIAPTASWGLTLLALCCAATVYAAIKLADATAAIDAADAGDVRWGAITLVVGSGLAAAGAAAAVISGLRT